jgi:heme-degrading monooxygenase HmoA
MIAAIAEIFLKDNQMQEYTDFAAQLKPLVDKIEGFISNERFQSVADPNKILSLSFWENEESIKQFRNLELHRLAETKSRESIFSDYRIRIANVSRDYGMVDRKEAPTDSKMFHDRKDL